MWNLITKKDVWELWQTPLKFLVCYRYGRVFNFFDSYEEAKSCLDSENKKEKII